ncbi:unnamed protein product [Cutaneotrichosporon oleaginosum]
MNKTLADSVCEANGLGLVGSVKAIPVVAIWRQRGLESAHPRRSSPMGHWVARPGGPRGSGSAQQAGSKLRARGRAEKLQ